MIELLCLCNFHNSYHMTLNYILRNVEEDHDDKDEKMPGAWESVKETALLVGVGVMGHSWDTYSDIGFSYLLASGTYIPAKNSKYASYKLWFTR